VVGLSGGLDSAVAALLLKERKYQVLGLSLFIHRQEDIPAAEKVAKVLGIPLETVDIREEFRKEIIDYFAREYLRGRTPNPCVLCNPKIKFRWLEEKARERGYEFVATGHYARIRWAGEEPFLAPARDPRKSQEYFLALLSPETLKKTLFPLGEYTKDEVRKMASLAGLPVLERDESQDVCFIQGESYNSFLEREFNLTPIPGKILSTSGRVLGTHQGFHRFTIGQRKGLGLPSGPFYVVKITPERNEVVVGSREEALRKQVRVSLKVWRGNPTGGFYKVRLRYRHPGAGAEVKVRKKEAMVEFETPQFAPTPGQLAVFYDEEDLVVGAGFIS